MQPRAIESSGHDSKTALVHLALALCVSCFLKNEIFSDQRHLGLEHYSDESKGFFRHPCHDG